MSFLSYRIHIFNPLPSTQVRLQTCIDKYCINDKNMMPKCFKCILLILTKLSADSVSTQQCVHNSSIRHFPSCNINLDSNPLVLTFSPLDHILIYIFLNPSLMVILLNQVISLIKQKCESQEEIGHLLLKCNIYYKTNNNNNTYIKT